MTNNNLYVIKSGKLFYSNFNVMKRGKYNLSCYFLAVFNYNSLDRVYISEVWIHIYKLFNLKLKSCEFNHFIGSTHYF